MHPAYAPPPGGRGGRAILREWAACRTTADDRLPRRWSYRLAHECRYRDRPEHPARHRCNKCWKWSPPPLRAPWRRESLSTYEPFSGRSCVFTFAPALVLLTALLQLTFIRQKPQVSNLEVCSRLFWKRILKGFRALIFCLCVRCHSSLIPEIFHETSALIDFCPGLPPRQPFCFRRRRHVAVQRIS